MMWIFARRKSMSRQRKFELGKIMRIIDIFFQLWLLLLSVVLLLIFRSFFVPFHSIVTILLLDNIFAYDFSGIGSKCRFDRWISVTVTTLRKLLLLFIRTTTAFALVFRTSTGAAELRVCMWMSSVVYFSVVIIVSINLYWQLGEFVNFLLALSSALKDEPIEKNTTKASATAASNIDASYWHVELSAKIKSNTNTDTTASHPLQFQCLFFRPLFVRSFCIFHVELQLYEYSKFV